MGKLTQCEINILRLKVIFKAFMMAFSVINLILWVNVKVKKLLVSFGNFAQVIYSYFRNFGQVNFIRYCYFND